MRYFIVSGLPLNNFDPALVERILELFSALLLPGGVLSYFEYLYVRQVKSAFVRNAAERARLQAVGSVVDGFLRARRNRAVAVAMNFPPAMAHHVWATRPSA